MPKTPIRTKSFVTLVDVGVRLRRHLSITYDGHLRDFAITLEHEVEGKWYAVARYDTTGGKVHRDRLKPDGTYFSHRESVNVGLDFSDALNSCAEDLMNRYAQYVSEFRTFIT